MNVQVISFHCVLKNPMGHVLSSTYNHDVMTHDPYQAEILPGLARGLQDLRKGEKRRICLRAENAFGYYDPDKVVERAIDDIPQHETLRLGDPIVSRSSDGKMSSLRVIKIGEDFVTLDGNHPLAGQDLIFEIEAVDTREATAEEISDIKRPIPTRNFH